MKRMEILETAGKMVTGQREQDYGTPENNFALIGDLWTAYWNREDVIFDAEDVAMMMALFKIARIKTGRGTPDSFVDACGYLACSGEIVTEAHGV